MSGKILQAAIGSDPCNDRQHVQWIRNPASSLWGPTLWLMIVISVFASLAVLEKSVLNDDQRTWDPSADVTSRKATRMSTREFQISEVEHDAVVEKC
jgi:hypothetical protein